MTITRTEVNNFDEWLESFIELTKIWSEHRNARYQVLTLMSYVQDLEEEVTHLRNELKNKENN